MGRERGSVESGREKCFALILGKMPYEIVERKLWGKVMKWLNNFGGVV